MSFIDPLWLLFLPLSALPFMVSISDKTTISNIQIFEQDGISRKITKLVQGQLADPIIEVGPGTGSLTNELLKDNYRIKAVEIDSDASDLLSTRFEDVPNLEVFNENAMTFDYSQLTGPWWIFVSNIHPFIPLQQCVQKA